MYFFGTGQESGTERANDSLILDCCKYFLQVRKQRAFLCSADKNLCFEAESECKYTLAFTCIRRGQSYFFSSAIHTISPSRSRYWCSQDIAQVVFGRDVDLTKFASRSPSY